MSRTGSSKALEMLEEEEREAVRKYFRLRKQAEKEARERMKRHLVYRY